MRRLTKNDNISVLNMSTRSTNCLKRAGIHTVGALLEYPLENLSSIRNLGLKSLKEIQKIITELDNESIMLANAESDVQDNNFFELESIDSNKDKFKCEYIEEDILIKDLNIPIRAKNSLLRAGYVYLSQVIGLKIEELMTIKNMGHKTASELVRFIEENQEEFFISDTNVGSMSLNELAKELRLCWNGNTSLWLREIVSIKKDFPLESDEAFLFRLYSSESAKNYISNFIVSKLKMFEDGITRERLFEHVPEHLYNIIALESILIEMESSNQIILENQKISIRYMSAMEFVETISDERYKKIVHMRLKGKSLKEIGLELNLTRERVRQLLSKAFKRHPRLREDKYAYLFKNYSFSKEDFLVAFCEPIEVFYYLETVYPTKHSSRRPINDILSDQSIPIALRQSAERVIYKDYIIINDIRIKKQRPILVKYFIENYCKNLTEFNCFFEQYHLWLDSLEIGNESSLCLESRSYENHISLSDYVLWNQGRCFRYFNISEQNYDELLDAINLENFENIEISTLKFYREYPELMFKYDIRDEYELHNLLKKIWPKEKYTVNFKKMPTIEIGIADRDKQVVDLLYQFAPISNEEFAAKYEEVYGVKAATVLANYLNVIDMYLYDGVYTLDFKQLSNAEACKMRELLVEDFYTISIVKRIYTNHFPAADISKINPFTLKGLGFLVYSGSEGYVVRNSYASSSSYFNFLLTKDDITDLRLINASLTRISAYQSELYNLKNSYEIIEYLPFQYVNIRRLSALGITKEDILDYCYAVSDFVEPGDCFTIESICCNGFRHKIDNLGFESWFYSSILIANKELFTYQKADGVRIIIKK